MISSLFEEKKTKIKLYKFTVVVVLNDGGRLSKLYQQFIVICREIQVYIIINHWPARIPRLRNKCFTRIERET